MANNDEAIRLLKRIAVAVEMLALGAATTSAPAAEQSEAVDLDGKYGDPEVRAKDPRDWSGEPMKGRRFSECPPEYLDMLAARFDYFAGRETDAKKAKYTRLDAARARGWAARKRNGWKPAAMAEACDDSPWQPSDGFGGFAVSGFEDVTPPADDIPF